MKYFLTDKELTFCSHWIDSKFNTRVSKAVNIRRKEENQRIVPVAVLEYSNS